MKRVFGMKKDKEPTPSLQDTSDRITKRGDNVEEKIKKLDAELARYKEQIKKTRPGPAQEAVKARAMRILKQKRTYEGQRDVLYNRTFKLDQAAFAAEAAKDAQQSMSVLKSANKDLKGMMKTNLQDEMMDLMDVSSEIHGSFGRRCYNVHDNINEDELLDDMGFETEGDGVLAYLQHDKVPDLEAEMGLPLAPSGNAQIYAGGPNVQAKGKLGLPAVPRASV